MRIGDKLLSCELCSECGERYRFTLDRRTGYGSVAVIGRPSNPWLSWRFDRMPTSSNFDDVCRAWMVRHYLISSFTDEG